MSPAGKLTAAGFSPQVKSYTIRGLFKSGMYEYDSTLAYITIPAAQDLLGFKQDIATGLELKVADVDAVATLAPKVREALGGPPVYVRTWIDMNGNLFKALHLEKTAMFVILVMIVLVGSFSIITTLVMLVMEKTRDIAVLMSMGATSKNIRRIFMLQGTIIGAVGTALGYLLGLSLALALEKYQFIKIPGDVYPMLGGKSSRGILSFTNPRVYDSNLAAGADIYRLYRAYDDFKKDTTGGKVRFAYPLGEYTVLSWDYRLDHYRIYHLNWNASNIIRRSAGWHWTSAVYAELDRDTVDSTTKPTKGTKNTLGVEYAGGVLSGDTAYVRPSFTSNFFYPLPFNFVFHWRGSAAVLFPNANGDIPVSERYYLGGINNVRGYEQDKISPRDPWTKERIGGKSMAFTNVETIFPISKSVGLYGVAFFDAGNTWREYSDVCFDFYKSVGAGVRWYSPMGLIRVEYGYGLDAEDHHMPTQRPAATRGESSRDCRGASLRQR